MRVLFIGNSHTFFNDMPQTFRLLAEAAGVPCEVTMLAHPGMPLSWHLKEAVEIRFAIVYGKYDYIIVQQAAHFPPAPPTAEETLADIIKLNDMAKACGSELIPTVTWAERDFPEHQIEMNRAYNMLMEQTSLRCSPAGGLFMDIKEKHPEINMYWQDGAHCSPYGSYGVACCVFSQLFGRSPEGLPAKGFSMRRDPLEDASCSLDEQQCAVIQRLAWENTVKINSERKLPE